MCLTSLPSRERGLKLPPAVVQRLRLASLPSRERGLKFGIRCGDLARTMSLPSRERGLKCPYWLRYAVGDAVAPFAGAWIEIGQSGGERNVGKVAPFAGAWIEIRPACI